VIKHLKRLYLAPRNAIAWRLLEIRNKGKSPKEIFSAYWRSNHWANPESRSGAGSTLVYTRRLRLEVTRLFNRLGITSLLDAPCGDFNWFKEVELGDIRYVGADIVDELVSLLNDRYASASRRFLALDVLRDPLPACQLWLCRDLIFHLPTSDVFRVLDRFADSNIEFLLITSHAGRTVDNNDTFMGGFRTVNLQMSPFLLPEPLQAIDDYVEGFPQRCLHLFSREQILKWRAQRART